MIIFQRYLGIVVGLFLLCQSLAWADGERSLDNFDSSRPDSHAPIGVMGDHIHEKGEWMTSYRYMLMDMNDNRIGDTDVSDDRVLQDFMVAPTDMQVQMHMIGVMHAAKESLTVAVTVPIIRKDMNHLNRAGVRFRTNSEGLGDIKVFGLIPFDRSSTKRWHANIGASIPTGSINEIDDLPDGKGKRLPYPMQLGSGTLGLIPGVTYSEQIGDWAWGAQAIGHLRVGRNKVGYSLGDELEASVWSAKTIAPDWSVSVRMKYKIWSNIDGYDNALIATQVPTADPKSRGGKKIDLLFGANYYGKRGLFNEHRFAFEAGIPIFESLDGPQLSTNWVLTLAWQKTF